MLNQLTSISIVSVSWIVPAAADVLVDFDDLPLAPASHYNGSDLAGGFSSRQTYFKNDYSAAFSAWQGFAFSNETDTTTVGWGNQYSAFAGGGSNAVGDAIAGNQFAVGFGFGPTDAHFNIPAWGTVGAIRVTNITYTALDLRDGSPFGFSKKFGGTSGNDPDWFKVTFTGYTLTSASGSVTGSVDFYLADFRSANNALDYIVNTWELVDLTPLGNARSVAMSFASSDVGAWGINTPTYAAIDNLLVLPEPAGMSLLAGLFAVSGRRRQAI